MTVCTGTWGELPCTRQARSGDGLCRLHAAAAALTGRATPAPAVPKPGAVPDSASSCQPPQSPATVQPPPREQPTVAGDPRILDRFAIAVRLQGVVGEVATAQLVYLVLTSRLLDKPASLIVKGHSASGKSYTVQVTLRFFPPEAVLMMTAMSQRALIYSDEQYAHRTIIMYEATGLRESAEDDLTAYLVRSLISEGRIDYPVTTRGKDGAFTTRHLVKEGPTNFIVTTTKVAIHAENETRLFSVSTDDSAEQTKQVLYALAAEAEPQPEALTDWVALQRWLARPDGPRRVTVPFATALVEAIPPVAVRLRRDVGTLFALLRAHALLHQASRDTDERGRVVATVDDAAVYGLAKTVMAEAVGATVAPAMRETIAAVAACLGTDTDTVTGQRVAEHLGLDKSAVSRRLAAARVAGYLVNAEDRRGRPAQWKLGDPLPDDVVLLPPPDQLRAYAPVAHHETADEGQPLGQPPAPSDGCSVAVDAKREREAAERVQGRPTGAYPPATAPERTPAAPPCASADGCTVAGDPKGEREAPDTTAPARTAPALTSNPLQPCNRTEDVAPEQANDPDLFAALTALAAGGLIETPACPECRRPLTPSDLAHGYTAHPACRRGGT